PLGGLRMCCLQRYLRPANRRTELLPAVNFRPVNGGLKGFRPLFLVVRFELDLEPPTVIHPASRGRSAMCCGLQSMTNRNLQGSFIRPAASARATPQSYACLSRASRWAGKFLFAMNRGRARRVERWRDARCAHEQVSGGP